MPPVAPEQWQRIRRSFEAALELPPEAREPFLAGLEREGGAIRPEVTSLLEAHDRAEQVSAFLARPAVSLLPPAEPGGGETGEQVGPYRLLRELGRGGMGTVYLAERADDAYRGRIAVKVLRRGLAAPDWVQRFEREREILAGLDHPHIARLLDGGSTADGRPYLVMEHVDGRRSDAHCAHVRLPLRGRLALFRNVCQAVFYAHQHGVVHGDLKPANVMVTDDGEPKLLDFGISRLLPSGARARSGRRGDEGSNDGPAALTPGYASPEQLLREPLTTASDVYSLGVLLFELVAGGRPFEPHASGVLGGAGRGAAPAQRPAPPPILAAAARFGRAVELASLGKLLVADLDHVVQRALAVEPGRRYATAGDLAAEVQRFLDGEPVEATPPTVAYLLRKRVRRHPTSSALAAIGLLALVATVATLSYRSWRSSRHAALAHRFGQEAQQIESIARSAALLPLETARLQEERLRRRIAGLEERVRALGREARGPAGYPLGVASYALGDLEASQEQLERAWRGGFRTAPVAHALARTLGERYRRALREAERIAAPELRREARLRAAEQLRDPAAGYLQIARAEPGLATLVEASLAFYDGHLAEAAALAASTFARLPWLFEAKRLEGDVYVEQAARAREREDLAATRDWLEQAGTAYAQAMAVARSEPRLHAAECARRVALVDVLPGTADTQAPFFAQALELCDRALGLDPGLVDALIEKSHLYLQRGRLRLHSEVGPDPDFAEGERLASAAIHLDPRSSAARLQLGLVHLEVLMRRDEQGLDVAELERRTETALKRAVFLSPVGAGALNSLGALYWYRAHRALQRGRDPNPDLQAAIGSYRRALELVPAFSRAHNNIGACRLQEAVYRGDRGEVADDAFDAAAESFRSAIAISPQVPLYFNNLGNALLELALHRHRRAIDPVEPQIAEAIASYREAIRLDPAYPTPWLNLGLAEKLRARIELAAGGDPAPFLERALEALDEAAQRGPNMLNHRIERAATLLLLARWRVSRGESPAAVLSAAETAALGALRVAAADPQALATRAEIAWSRARWLPARDGAGAIQEGRKGVAAALAAYPEYPYALALSGALDLLEAERASGPRRRELAVSALASLEQAARLDRYLDPELGALLPRARTLAGAAPAVSDSKPPS